MYHSFNVIKCLLSLLLLMAIQCVNGDWHPPVLRRDGVMPERRQLCPDPAPNVDKDEVSSLRPTDLQADRMLILLSSSSPKFAT